VFSIVSLGQLYAHARGMQWGGTKTLWACSTTFSTAFYYSHGRVKKKSLELRRTYEQKSGNRVCLAKPNLVNPQNVNVRNST
jgi:hypothetical protein